MIPGRSRGYAQTTLDEMKSRPLHALPDVSPHRTCSGEKLRISGFPIVSQHLSLWGLFSSFWPYFTGGYEQMLP